MSLSSVLAALFPEFDRPLVDADSPATIDSWDSFRQVEIVVALEEEYEIRLSTADIAEITSVAAMSAVLRRLGAEAEP